MGWWEAAGLSSKFHGDITSHPVLLYRVEDSGVGGGGGGGIKVAEYTPALLHTYPTISYRRVELVQTRETRLYLSNPIPLTT